MRDKVADLYLLVRILLQNTRVKELLHLVYHICHTYLKSECVMFL